MVDPLAVDVTEDVILGGRVNLLQPRHGFRTGVDAVFLAAACPAKPGQSVLDMGCGVGAVALCLAARMDGLRLAGVEVQRDVAGLACLNSRRNKVDMKVHFADVTELPDDLRQQSFDHVVSNPPYYMGAARQQAVDTGRETALAETVPLADWVDACIRRLAPGGTLTLIVKALRTRDLLAALDDRVGGTVLKPFMPREGRDADLVILRTTKGARAPFRLAAPLLIHEGARHVSDGEDYTDSVRSVLRDAAPIDF